MWLSLVERHVRDVEVASSNLVISTTGGAGSQFRVSSLLFFIYHTTVKSVMNTITIFPSKTKGLLGFCFLDGRT